MSEIVRGFIVFSSGFMSAFFQYERKLDVLKEQLHMEVRGGVIVRDTNFSICCDIASCPMLFALSCFKAV